MKLYTRILLLAFLFSATAFKALAVTASFTADVTAGCAPLVVHFTNTSTGATSYSWDLGNGVLTTLTDPSTSYTLPGTYTVKLTSYGTGGPSVSTMTITVYPAPKVDFTVTDTSICPGTPISFTSTTVGGVPGPLTYTWNFGDGYSSTLTTPAHTYTASGYYNVTLSATNSMGCVSSLTKSSFVHVFTPPVPNFAASSVYFCKTPGVVTFSNASTGTPGLIYKWDFGDGSTSSTKSPVHSYTANGTYTVKLTVTDGNGCIDSAIKPALIYVGKISASFTPAASACVYSWVSFPNTSSPHIASNWDFGDGHTSTSDTGVNFYTTPGTYTVRLIIFDGTCYDTITHSITILPKPTGSFTISPLNPCPAPATITFTGTGTPGSTFAWKFGDGGTGSGAGTSHTYTYNASDTISMIVTNGSGCKDTIVQVFNIYNLIVEMNHTMVQSGCVPLTVNFSCFAHTTVPDSITYHAYPYALTGFVWTFGDGSPTSTLPTPLHTYTAVGIYLAKVVVTTANGCKDSAYITIFVGKPPVAGFYAIPTHICADRDVTFFNTSTGADAFKWFFGDGYVSGVDSPIHRYFMPGTYSDTLIAYYRGCPDTFIRKNYILVDSPYARMVDTALCTPRKRVDFVDSSIGETSHLFVFGDGLTSTLFRAVHDYPTLGNFNAYLAAYNSRSGCRDTAYQGILLVQPIPDFTASRLAVCRDQSVTFTAKVIGVALQYWWGGAGGVHSDSTLNPYIDTFHVTGLKTIQFAILDSMTCWDTISKYNYITVAKPVANFKASPTTGCWPLTVTFTDMSTDCPGVTFSNFLWAYGDGGTGFTTSPSIVHTFTAAGTFNTSEIVTDNIGCRDTVILPLVTVWRPHASFSAPNQFPCIGDNCAFINSSTSAASSYWMFGDGGTSTLTFPTHVYMATGYYTVTLIVTDSHGCKDTAIYSGYISVTKPSASFFMDDSVAICPPLLVNFTNTSTGGSSYLWTFGDGSSAVVPSPSNLYIKSGYDTVLLVVTNVHGCMDTAYGHVNLFGYAGAFTYTPIKGCAPLTVYFKAKISNVPNIIWDFADGTTSKVSYLDTMVYTYTLPGAYLPKLILSDNTGCENSSIGIDTIKVDKVYPGFTTIPNPICINTSVNFKDTSRSYFSTITSWSWTFTNGDVSALSTPPYFYTTPGIYPVNLVVTDGWGCTDSIKESIVVYPPPVITTSPDTTICLTDAATLSGFGGVSYTWIPAATVSCTNCNPTKATPTDVTTYTVTGTDAHGCVNSDTVSVFIKTKTVSHATGDTEICRNVVAQLHDSGGTTYQWIPGTGLSSPTIAEPYASPDFTTKYIVLAKLGSCIPDTQFVWVNVHQLPTVNAGPDQRLVEGSIAQLQATGNLVQVYSWGNPGTLSCDSCANPLATMSVTTTYVVHVTSDFGCKNSDSVTIHIFCDKSQIFIPNTFTPNGDGQNDIFYPRGIGVSVIKSFRIYNRWGQLLFERTDIQINDASNAWDGTYLGANPKPDVYVYVLDALCETGEPINIKGDVTVIR